MNESNLSVQSPDDFMRAAWRSATEILIDCTWSARSFQKAAARWATVALVLGLPGSVIASLTAAGAGASAVWGKSTTVTAVLALASAVVAGLKAVLRPDDTTHAYAAKGALYLALRNETRQFRNIELLVPGKDLNAVATTLKRLTDRLNALAQQPPIRIPTWAYSRAKKSIDAGESDYENDHFWQEAPF